MSEMTFTGKLCAWGRLLRIPNLFTAPWDPVCGFLIAGGELFRIVNSGCFIYSVGLPPEKIVSLAIAALCAYAFGLVTNDIADLKTDMAERPERPLPSGEISMKEAFIAVLVLCIIVLELSFFVGHYYTCFCMMLLLGVILLYNYCGRKSALLSSALMGLCRVFSFGIGVAAVYPEIPSLNMTLCALYAAGMFLFILGITLVARRETETLKSRPGRNLIPAGALLMAVSTCLWILSIPFGGIPLTFSTCVYIVSELDTVTLLGAPFLLLLFFGASAEAWLAFGKMQEPAAVQKKIGFLIRTLILVQCAVILPFSLSLGITVACCFPLACLASWKFYGS